MKILGLILLAAVFLVAAVACLIAPFLKDHEACRPEPRKLIELNPAPPVCIGPWQPEAIRRRRHTAREV